MTAGSPRVGWICLVCWRAAADRPGTCARDGVPLSPLVDEEVEAALRARVQRRGYRREAWRVAGAGLAAALVALASCAAFGWRVLPRAGDGLYSSAAIDLGLALFVLLALASYAVVRPLSAEGDVATLLARAGLDRPRPS